MNCRSCGRAPLTPIMSFGDTPLADGVLTRDQLDEPELQAPLELVFCPRCTLVQIAHTAACDLSFGRGEPASVSVASDVTEHFTASALKLIETRGLTPDSMVIEAANNGGSMLSTFVDAGISVLGIDTASEAACIATERGVPTVAASFGLELAEELRDGLGIRADVFLANDVLEHVPDLNDFVQAIRMLLKSDGVAVIEVPYVGDLIEKCEFDAIYHQHLCYFSLRALDQLFTRSGVFLNDVERTSIRGGSLRVFVQRYDDRRGRVDAMLAAERARRMDSPTFYAAFAARVAEIKERLGSLLSELHDSGHRIAAYGAAAKATTLCSYVGIGPKTVEYVVDRNCRREGRYMGGNHLPIVSLSRLRDDPPDYLLLLAGNVASEIIRQEAEFRARGGRFIIPIPKVEVVS